MLRSLCLTATMFAGLSGVVSEAAGSDDSTSAAPTIRDTGSELIIETVPVALPLHESHGHHHMGVFPPVGTVEIPVSGFVHGFDYEIVDSNGRVLPREILHHFNVINPEKRELFLPISQRFMAAGKETGEQTIPWMLFGVPIHQGQHLVVSAMLHNPTDSAHENVMLRIKVKYTKSGRPWPFFPVFPFQIDVAFPAGDKSFDLPPGTFQKSWEGSPSTEGRIIALGSHLHELATHITFEDVTTNEVLWTGYPVYSEDGTLGGVTVGRLYRQLGVRIYPDHVYRVTVHYDNPDSETIHEGGMGLVAGVFIPSDADQWPEPEKSSDLYRVDRMHYMREVRGKLEEIASAQTEDSSVTMTDESHKHDTGEQEEHAHEHMH